MKTNIIQCPTCKSKNVVWYQETIVTKYHKLKRNGEPYKTGHLAYTDGNAPRGYKCEDCNFYESELISDLQGWKISNEN